MKIYFAIFLLFLGRLSYSQTPPKIVITVCIIGNSKLHIKDDKLFWENLNDIPPGQDFYTCRVVTKVNGKQWDDWKTPFQLGFTTKSFAIVGTVLLKNEISELVQSPSAENGWETIWWFNDPSPEAHTYSTSFELIPSSNKKPVSVNPKSIKRDTVIQEYILNKISFEVGNAILTKESLPELDKIYESLKLSTKRIEISGHTNNVGEKEKLQKLSEDRALAVYNYLLIKGVSKERMSYHGYGDTKPILSNNTDEGKIKNRRVEIKIIK
jgi:outer membrane protein OmpA-like peptidoglycan-associated protein